MKTLISSQNTFKFQKLQSSLKQNVKSSEIGWRKTKNSNQNNTIDGVTRLLQNCYKNVPSNWMTNVSNWKCMTTGTTGCWTLTSDGKCNKNTVNLWTEIKTNRHRRKHKHFKTKELALFFFFFICVCLFTFVLCMNHQIKWLFCEYLVEFE